MRINNKYIYQIILNYLLSYITLGLPRNTSTEGTPSGTWIFRDGRNPRGLPRLFPERVIGNPSHIWCRWTRIEVKGNHQSTDIEPEQEQEQEQEQKRSPGKRIRTLIKGGQWSIFIYF